ncbi:uncharacterized protein J3R85_011280 [Psidium guajava]|nr:uncharacterized protein J3R85_011280 [Psidium guajava]
MSRIVTPNHPPTRDTHPFFTNTIELLDLARAATVALDPSLASKPPPSRSSLASPNRCPILRSECKSSLIDQLGLWNVAKMVISDFVTSFSSHVQSP